MQDMGKAIATIAIWGGTAGLCYLFHSFGILAGEEAGFMVFGALALTAFMWA